MKHSFNPVIDPNSTVLILGTLPGDESLRQQQYYANPRNQFWTILEQVYQEPVGNTYEDKLQFLRDKHLALWDVLQSAHREGSLDQDIKNEIPNDFASLFKNYPALRRIAFNGRKAETYFRRYVLKAHGIKAMDHVQFCTLPSSSPMRGKGVLSLDQKIAKWHVIAER